MTKLQELLGKILRNRIEREKADGTLDADKTSLSDTLDIFIAGNKITADQYSEFTELINPAAATTNSTSNTTTTGSTTTKSDSNTDTSKTA
jgi:hypothetical protein